MDQLEQIQLYKSLQKITTTDFYNNKLQELKQKVEKLEKLITEKVDHLEKIIISNFKILEETKLNYVQESLQKM